MRTRNGNLGNLIWTEPKENVKKQMTPFGLEDDNVFIEIIKNSLKKVRTKRGLFFLFVYVFAFIFSLVAIIVTVFGLTNFGGYEEVEYTRKLFTDFGYPLGSLILVLGNFFALFILPFLGIIIISCFEEESFYNFVSIIGFSIIEAYALDQFSIRFLNMFSDIRTLYLIINRRYWFDPLKSELLTSVFTQIFLATFFILLLIRIITNIRKNKY